MNGVTAVTLSDRPRKYRQLVAGSFPVQLPQELDSWQSTGGAAAVASCERFDAAVIERDWVAGRELIDGIESGGEKMSIDYRRAPSLDPRRA